MTSTALNLPSYGAFAAALACAGLPIYIHAPKFYVDEYGVPLTSLGVVLFGLRLLDVVQDPLLGKLSEAIRHARAMAVWIGAAIMAGAMYGLLAVPPPIAPLIWFGMMLSLVFSAFSFLTITFYAQGVSKAAAMEGPGHIRLAQWREAGALIGICIAAVTPSGLGLVLERPFTGFAIGFVGLCLVAVYFMRFEWHETTVSNNAGLRTILRDDHARRLLGLALLNATPVAVSSTLFLFFVESRLAAPGLEGPLLLLFFASAAMSAPIWGAVAQKRGIKPALLWAMALAIGSFSGALFLGPGDWLAFVVICVLAGAAIGADLTLLPAAFAQRLSEIAPGGAQGFGVWAFVSKFALAFAAVSLLPVLDWAGFQSGSLTNSEHALWTLTALYAGLPCILKLMAMALLAKTEMKEG